MMRSSRIGSNLWLALRFLKKQKLRTVTIFCGILFSCFLMTAFGSFGYDFWRQVHSEAKEETKFDSTQRILVLLVMVLLLLVASCAAILLHNLFSLTFLQRWRSLSRLISLGADLRDMAVMEVMGTGILFCIAAPVGYMLTFVLGHLIGISHQAPFCLSGGGMLWIFLVSCSCGIRPLLAAFYKAEGWKWNSYKTGRRVRHVQIAKRTARNTSGSFWWYMSKKYRHANRGHYVRITVTVIAAILLYVPAGYLIDTNISVQQSGLYAKYGIEYSCSPQNKEELAIALEECGRLLKETEDNAMSGGGGSSMGAEAIVCVSLYAAASVRADAISAELYSALKAAGWDGGGREGKQLLEVDAAILFVDDPTYITCLQMAGEAGNRKDMLPFSGHSILVNRYMNRTCWVETSDVFFRETSLLADGADSSAVQVYYDVIHEYEPDREKYIVPDLILDELPEGIGFTGDLSLILPFSSMEELCLSDAMYERLWVYGKWEDSEEGLFDRLEQCLGEHPIGKLAYTRRMLKEWYSSMKGIHMAMNAISLMLFSVAVLNIFSMVIFQYMERKKGLAVLWSAGQSMGGLLNILVAEHMVHFLLAAAVGIPLSGLLCYIIYRIFRQAWQIKFALPIKQVILISVSALIVSGAALLLDGILMRHQDFLSDIKEIT